MLGYQRLLALCCLFVLCGVWGGVAAPAPPAQGAGLSTLYLIGDSTVKNGTRGQMGWGDPLAGYFDTMKVNVVNRARGGRSSRTFLTEGLWDQVLAVLKPGDFVLMQFGHNDGGSPNSSYRASLKGTGDETRDVTDAKTMKTETVRSYGWYLRRYVKDAKAKGATPIVLSLIPRNRWGADNKVFRAAGDYGKWAAEVAREEQVPFVDLNAIVADQFDAMGKEKVDPLFGGDWTHTNAAGAEIIARSVVAGLKALPRCALCSFLAAKAADIAPYRPTSGVAT